MEAKLEKLREFIEKKKEKSASRKPRYGTRKLSVGLVSCVLGYCIFLSPSVVNAQVEEGASEVGSSTSIETSADVSGGDTESTKTKEKEAVVDTNETPVAEVAETETTAEEVAEENVVSPALEERAVEEETGTADQAMQREEALA